MTMKVYVFLFLCYWVPMYGTTSCHYKRIAVPLTTDHLRVKDSNNEVVKMTFSKIQCAGICSSLVKCWGFEYQDKSCRAKINHFAFNITVGMYMKEQCPNGGTFNRGNCYLYFSIIEGAPNIDDPCKSFKMQMVEVTSAAENKFLTEFLKERAQDDIWLGAKDEGTEGNWRWTTSRLPLTFKNWVRGEPEAGGIIINAFWNCMVAKKEFNFQWSDAICTRSVEYVCEAKWPKTKAGAYSADGAYNVLEDCPNGGKAFQDSCYYFMQPPTVWLSAYRYCEYRHLQLVEITSASENGFLAHFLKFAKISGSNCVWTGLNDQALTGWEWSPSGRPVTYTNWLPGQPNDHITKKAFCVSLVPYGRARWQATSCLQNCHFVCEKK